MKGFVLSAVAAVALSAAPALAADMPVKAVKAPVYVNPWDIAFGGGIASDYNFRGISQSDRGPSPFAYFEPRYNINPNLQLYAGIASYGIDLPSDGTAEVDFYGGIRPTFGPLALDFGLLYYYYPRENGHSAGPGATFPPFPNGGVTLNNTDFLEFYAKATYTFNDQFSLGAAVYYTSDYLNSGANGTYGSLNAKYNLPSFSNGVGWYISGEYSHYWLGAPDFNPFVFNPNIDLPNYSTWNAGLAFTYKVLTLDLRYYDTNLTREECFYITQDPTTSLTPGTPTPGNLGGIRSNWCSSSFVAKLSFDTTLAAFK